MVSQSRSPITSETGRPRSMTWALALPIGIVPGHAVACHRAVELTLRGVEA